MRTVAVTTALQLTEEDLRAFVEERGGVWREDFGVHQGMMARDGGEILVSLETDTFDAFDEHDMASEQLRVGFLPRALVVIGVIRSADPRLDHAAVVLGREVARQVAQQWGGHIDWEDLSGCP